jgi:alpha-1,2-mannosyltransferase
LVLGQINLLLVLMIVVDLAMTPSCLGKRLPRGVLVGFAAAVKLTPLVFIPYLALSGQWRDARRAVACFILATGAMFVVAPRASWQYFTGDAYDVKRVGDSALLGNQTLRAALVRSHLGADSALLVCVLGIMLCAGLVLAALAYRRSSAMLGMLVCAATGLMISPISWLHHYVWIVPILVWLVCGLDRPAGGAWWAVAGAFVFAVVPQAHAEVGVFRFVQANSYVLATLTFVVLVAIMLWHRSATSGVLDAASPETTAVLVLGSSGRPSRAWPGPPS